MPTTYAIRIAGVLYVHITTDEDPSVVKELARRKVQEVMETSGLLFFDEDKDDCAIVRI